MKHMRDNESFFDEAHSKQHADFGFSGSISKGEAGGKPPFAGDKPTRGQSRSQYADGGEIRGGTPPYAGDEPTHGMKHVAEPMEEGEEAPGDYAHGGHVHPHGGHIVREEHRADGGTVCHMSHGGMTIHHPDGHVTHHMHDGKEVKAEHMAHGGEYAGAGRHLHPHGHHVVKVEQMASGAVIHHHAHGGHTVHHEDGRITHHMADGTPAHLGMMQPEHMHDESEYAHRARGGSMEDEREDKAMVKKAFREHDQHMHHGEHEDIELARGGEAMLPRGMRPKAARHHSPIGEGMPVNTPPRFGRNTTTPRNAMPGGQMAYGVEPGSEPDEAGSEQGIPQLRRGGKAR